MCSKRWGAYPFVFIHTMKLRKSWKEGKGQRKKKGCPYKLKRDSLNPTKACQREKNPLFLLHYSSTTGDIKKEKPPLIRGKTKSSLKHYLVFSYTNLPHSSWSCSTHLYLHYSSSSPTITHHDKPLCEALHYIT